MVLPQATDWKFVVPLRIVPIADQRNKRMRYGALDHDAQQNGILVSLKRPTPLSELTVAG
jgi:hypothetical protein